MKNKLAIVIPTLHGAGCEKLVSEMLGGAGGGNQRFAQGGGKEKFKKNDAIEKAKAMVLEV